MDDSNKGARRRKPRKRPCRLCGTDLNLWGPDARDLCPECKKRRREVRIICAGRCKQAYPLREMELVRINFDPGYKEGTKVKLFYCPSCRSVAKRMALKIQQKQEDILARFDRRRGELKEGEDE